MKGMTERVQMPPHRNNQSDGFVISDEAQEFLNKGAIIIRMRGLPYECTPKQVIDFFREGDQSCEVYDGEDGILFVKKPDGKSTGDAFVQFLNEPEAAKALSKHKELIGPRYIELFRSTPAEVEQVLRKSQETRPRVPPPQIPLVAPLPTPQITLPQRIITSGTRKDCIRLRGLPYEATVEHILDFLGNNHSKNIVFQGVHMVYKAHGQPSGEAFIQMNSEASAAQASSQCHYNKMHCGKKVRYVEVFQCSGDDMNAILNSGHLSPKTTTVMNPAGIDNNIHGMGLPLAPTMLPYYEPSPIHMMPFIQNPFLLNQLALQQQQNALAASFMNKSPHQKSLYPTYQQWPPEMDPYKPSTTTSTTTTDSLTKPKMSEAEIVPHQQDFYSTYGTTQPSVYYLPRVFPNPMFTTKPGFPTVQAPVLFPQVNPTLPQMGVLGVKRSWEQAFPLETAAAVQGAKRWQTPQVASFQTPGFFPDVG